MSPLPNVDHLAVVRAVRATLPAGGLTPDQAANACHEVAKRLASQFGEDAGLMAKASGSGGEVPGVGRVSQDIVMYATGEVYDVWGNVENTATPQWIYKGQAAANFYRPPVLDPTPPEPPTPPDGDLEARVTELERIVSEYAVRFRVIAEGAQGA